MTDSAHCKLYTNAFGETSFSDSKKAHSSNNSNNTNNCDAAVESVVKRGIFEDVDLENFKKSETCNELLKFIQICADSVVGKTITGVDYVVSEKVVMFQTFMNRLLTLVDETPPMKQPMRFGNKAFRTWHQKLVEESDSFIRELFTEITITDKLVDELSVYLCSSFGNEVRIDYGTGHELNITVFFYCLYKLKLFVQSDLTAVILRGFSSYIRVMRKLQTTYMLEPAGSHGVWGLDDYHCLTFFWGAAQLCHHTSITPSSIHDKEVLDEFKDDFMYLEGIDFIKRLKSSAPFAETSPMLNDISGVSDWIRVTDGLMRLFKGEVLYKRPVVQHLPFGSILQCTWTVSSIATTRNIGPTFDSHTSLSGVMPIHALHIRK